MPKATDPFFDHYAHLKTFPDHILRDLARNEAAPRDYRKFAVELLYHRKSPYVKHQDLREFVAELEAEFDGLQLEFPAPDLGPGPLVASVTTETMFSDIPVVDNITVYNESSPGVARPESVLVDLDALRKAGLYVDTVVPTETVVSPEPIRKQRAPKPKEPDAAT